MKVYIVDNTHYLDSQEKRTLKNQVKLILKNLNLSSNTETCITFVDDGAMKNLNETYRGIKRATDVLSFPQSDIAIHNKPILGDVIISVETAKRHARLYKNSLKKEIQKLVIHGILHLLGYNHKKKNDADIMRRKEKGLLSLINQ